MTIKQELLAREKMLASRGASIGSSDVAAIVGMDRFRDAGDVYDEKIAELDGTVGVGGDADPTPDQLRGIIDEPIAAELYSMRSGIKMRRMSKVVHPDLPFWHSNIDRQALADSDWDTHPIEIKCPRPSVFQRIVEHGADPYVIIQSMAHLACLPQYDFVRIVYFETVTKQTHAIVLERRDDLIASLEKAVVQFWYEHVEKRERPTVFNVDLPQMPELSGSVEVWDDEQVVEFTESLAKLHLIQQVAKQADQYRKMGSEHMCKRMGPIKTVQVPDVGRFTHVVVQPRLTWDSKALDAHFKTMQDDDLLEIGLKKPKAGYEFIRATFDKDALERLRPAATNLLLNGIEGASVRQLEEGDTE